MFRGSSQARKGGPQVRVQTRKLKKLKARVQAIRFEACLKARSLYLITFFDGMNEQN